MGTDHDKSLGDAATHAGAKGRPARDEVSLGDERTFGGGDAAGVDTILEDLEIFDLSTRYRVEGTLGQGGMGAVLLATDTRLGRKVAIKRILGEAAGNRMAVSRFLTEAKAIARISHPNVVQIHELGRAADGPFLVMEYVDGGTLADRSGAGALPIEQTIDLTCQLCDGLARAHDAGIVHRDIKPANVLLTKDGIPKLTDFGLAKAEAADHRMTMTGAVMGTPDFMPPEQRRDAGLVDHRSDLWSLAATVYQMVTGRSPKVIDLRHVPDRLRDVLARALEDDKDARYQSARELRDALKTSVRAAETSPAPVVIGDLAEGTCRACGTVNTDLARKFCRNPSCGASLRMTCLSCDATMPVWEAVCGECGGNQPKIVAGLRTSLDIERSAAEARLAEFAFDEAAQLAAKLAGTAVPQLADVADWGRSFGVHVADERLRQEAIAAEKLRDAEAHRSAFDYPAAIHALEAVPQPLRTPQILHLLAECQQAHEEATRLIDEISARVKQKKIDGLLPLVERAMELRGDRKDLAKLRAQLITWPDRTRASLKSLVARLVREAKADSTVTPEKARDILEAGEEYLSLDPDSVEIRTLVTKCRRRVAKYVRTSPPGNALEKDRVAFGIAISDDALRLVACGPGIAAGDPADSHARGFPAIAVISADGSIVVGERGSGLAMHSRSAVITDFVESIGPARTRHIATSTHHGDAAVVFGADGSRRLVAGIRRPRPETLVTKLLTAARVAASADHTARDAACVIAVPAGLGLSARDALRRAAEEAGVTLRRIVCTTHAEALACYRMRDASRRPADGVHVIIHWGWSGCEVTVFSASAGVLEIESTLGDTSLGSRRCRNRLAEHLLARAGATGGLHGLDNLKRRYIESLADSLRRDLEEQAEASVTLPPMEGIGGATASSTVMVTRAEYEASGSDVIQGIRDLVMRTLTDARRTASPDRITGHVYLTGTNARSKAIHAVVRELFPWDCLAVPAHPEYVASLGAALWGCILNGDLMDYLVLNSYPRSIGVETDAGVFTKLVWRNTRIPVDRKQVFHASGTRLAIRLFEGEEPNARDNDLIAAMVFETSEPSGEPHEVEVKVAVQPDGCTATITSLRDGKRIEHRLPHIETLDGEFGNLCDWSED